MWDTLGRKVRIDDPDSGQWSFEYYDDGLLKARKDAAGRTQSYTFDSLRRIKTRGFSPEGGGSHGATFVYGADPLVEATTYGRLIETNSAGTSYDFSYDAAGRLNGSTQISAGHVFYNEFVLDQLGRVTSRTFPDEETFT